LEGGSYRVAFDNETYILGEMGDACDYTLEKQSLIHKMAIYTAVARMGGRDNVKLVIGCPVSVFMSDEHRRAYAAYIKDEPLGFKVDDMRIKLNFEKVLVLPEGAGVIYQDPERFKGKSVAVVDLGGRNMNFTVYNDLKPQLNSMLSTNNGSMEIEMMVKKAFGTRYKLALENEDVENILRQGGILYRGELEGREMLKEILEEYVDKTLRDISQANFNLETMEVVFTGGTSLLCSAQILERLPHAFVGQTSQWDNVQGFYRLAKSKYKE
jgi:plasmid segregation protein ParM